MCEILYTSLSITYSSSLLTGLTLGFQSTPWPLHDVLSKCTHLSPEAKRTHLCCTACLYQNSYLWTSIWKLITENYICTVCLLNCINKYLIKSQVINCFLWCNGFSSWFAVCFVHVSFLKQSPSLQLDIRNQEHFRSCCLVNRKPGDKAQVSNPQSEQRAAV